MVGLLSYPKRKLKKLIKQGEYKEAIAFGNTMEEEYEYDEEEEDKSDASMSISSDKVKVRVNNSDQDDKANSIELSIDDMQGVQIKSVGNKDN